jgi:hypothetical protein
MHAEAQWINRHAVDVRFGMTRMKIKSREKSENGRQSHSRRLNIANTLLSNKKILRKKESGGLKIGESWREEGR